jgi:formylglycine-generating enzyme required for sulfatase activity
MKQTEMGSMIKKILMLMLVIVLYGCKKDSPTESLPSEPLHPINPGMATVPSGAFHMGCTTGNADEQPVHSVRVDSFSIDKYEITYEKWSEVRNWGLTHGYLDIHSGRDGFNPVGENNPVTEVNWYDVVKWCNARSEMDGLEPLYYSNNSLTTLYRSGEVDLPSDAVKWKANGYRLPTEAEWEYAATCGKDSTSSLFSGSNVVDSVAWVITNSNESTHSVGQKTSNTLGIYDMSGNVWEWCWDWYGPYTDIYQQDPHGALSGNSRVLKGGSFANLNINNCRSEYRNFAYAFYSNYAVGFRCVLEN